MCRDCFAAPFPASNISILSNLSQVFEKMSLFIHGVCKAKRFAKGYLQLQFDLASHVDYEAEEKRVAKFRARGTLLDIKQERIRAARITFQV